MSNLAELVKTVTEKQATTETAANTAAQAITPAPTNSHSENWFPINLVLGGGAASSTTAAQTTDAENRTKMIKNGLIAVVVVITLMIILSYAMPKKA